MKCCVVNVPSLHNRRIEDRVKPVQNAIQNFGNAMSRVSKIDLVYM